MTSEGMDFSTKMDYCRACMISDNSNDMIFLYKNNINIMYSECTSLTIHDTDNLPAYICTDCNQQLHNFNQFRQKCQSSETIFRENIKVETNESSELADNSNNDSFQSSMVVIEQYISDTKVKDCNLGQISSGALHVTDSIKSEINWASENEFSDNVVVDDEEDELGTKTKIIKKRKIVQNPKSMTCDMCGKKFKKKHRLVAHLRQHIGLKGFTCEICEKDYSKWSSLFKHLKIEHPADGNFQCEFEGCGKTFPHKPMLTAHMTVDHNVVGKEVESSEKHVCEICSKICYKKHRMDAHMRTHQGLNPFLCKLCGRDFAKYNTFARHTKMKHTDFEKFKCDFEGCDKVYNFSHTLKIHKETIHLGKPNRAQQQRFVCEQCGKSFNSTFALRKHSYSHTGERPFGCDYCTKRFTSKYKLKIHVMRHENVRNHVCPICGLKKTTAKELKVHVNYHTKETVYPCKMCPSTFTSYNNASRHMRVVHRGYKPYECSHCQRTFGKQETLKHHVMTHTGEKPHACHICDKRFIQVVALRKHLTIHNKIKT